MDVARSRISSSSPPTCRVSRSSSAANPKVGHVVDADLVAADPSHERDVLGARPQFEERPWVSACVLPEGVMTPVDKLWAALLMAQSVGSFAYGGGG
jgi:hypothetical protein